MTAQPTAAERVRRTLRSLATDPPSRAGDGEGSPPQPIDAQRDLVDEAERALASVRTAAAFADDDGFRRTGTVAETTPDRALARRARGVIETIGRYRAAYADAASRDGVDSADPSDPPGPADTDVPTDSADHFRSGRDRHMPAAEQPESN